jgi:hypothetical protein
MSDAEDDTPKPRTWTQWAQDSWQWLLPLGLAVLAGLVAAILWYYRAAAPLTAPPNVSVVPPIVPATTIPVSVQTPGAQYNVVAGIPQVALATGQVYYSALPRPPP